MHDNNYKLLIVVGRIIVNLLNVEKYKKMMNEIFSPFGNKRRIEEEIYRLDSIKDKLPANERTSLAGICAILQGLYGMGDINDVNNITKILESIKFIYKLSEEAVENLIDEGFEAIKEVKKECEKFEVSKN